MWLIFLDEFGDFSARPNDMLHPSWRPVCGYGGFLLPANRYLEFCENFEQMRVIGTRRIAFARFTSNNNGRKISYADFEKEMGERRSKSYSKAAEVKGSDFFSTSYLTSPNRRGDYKRTIRNFRLTIFRLAILLRSQQRKNRATLSLLYHYFQH